MTTHDIRVTFDSHFGWHSASADRRRRHTGIYLGILAMLAWGWRRYAT
jgi:hypothetical protein